MIAECMKRHRHQEFLRFLKRLDQKVPDELELHLVLDNYQTHKHPVIRRWLQRTSRFHFHFIPTSSYWLNLVERWLAKLTTTAIRRGAFSSVEALEQAIYDYVEHSNDDPRPFVWTATPQSILDKIDPSTRLAETQR